MFCSKCGVENKDDSSFCKDCGQQFGMGVEGNLNTKEIVLPASLTQRFLNSITDSIAMYIFGIGIGVITYFIFGRLAAYIVGTISFFAYYLIFEALFQKTLGKVFTGTKVVNLKGEKPSFLSILGRSLARHIPFEAFSFFFYGSHPAKGWHDRLSHTLVVPKKLTPEEVSKIDLNGSGQKDDNFVLTIVLVIFGFLVFIAIIGILSSIVLASLNSARMKGYDASVKAKLAGAGVQSILYYEDNLESYAGFCESVKKDLTLNMPSGEKIGNYVCNENSSEFAISVPLKGGDYFCIDNTGPGKIIANQITSQTSCSSLSNNTNSGSVESQDDLSYEDLLKEIEEGLKSVKLPMMVDEETRIDNVYVSDDKKINYDYTLINYNSSDLNWAIFESSMLPQVKVSYCVDESLKYYREKNVIMKWNYFGKDEIFIGSIELSKNNCN